MNKENYAKAIRENRMIDKVVGIIFFTEIILGFLAFIGLLILAWHKKYDSIWYLIAIFQMMASFGLVYLCQHISVKLDEGYKRLLSYYNQIN